MASPKSKYKVRYLARLRGVPMKSRAKEFVPYWCVQPINPKGILSVGEVEHEMIAFASRQKIVEEWGEALKENDLFEMRKRIEISRRRTARKQGKVAPNEIATALAAREARIIAEANRLAGES